MYSLLTDKGNLAEMAATIRDYLLSGITAKPFIENSTSTV